MGESDDPLNNPDHIIQVKYKNSSNTYTIIDNNSFDGYQLMDSAYYLPASSFGASTDVVISSLPGNFSVSHNNVPYVTMKFPHTPNLENKNYFEMFVPQQLSQSQSYYTFSNDTISSAYLYDLTNHLRIPVINKNVLVPNSLSGGENFCVVKSESQFLPVTSIKPVHGTGSFINYSALAVDSAFIIITNKNLMGATPNDGVNAYKNYRVSSAGGNHNVLVADIEDLYDEFGYGIPKFPFAIRHFVDYCLDTFPAAAPPKNLFLIGKSVQPDKIRNQSAKSDPTGKNYAITFVPSIGFPTCDNMLVAGLNGTLMSSPVPIGRLAAQNIKDVNTYLAKVADYEHPLPDPDEWMKHAIFIGGGANAGQQAQLCGYVNNYATIIEDTSFGGHAHIFCKNSSSPTQTSYSDSIKELINSGVSLLTFFGHTSATVFEFNILPPDQYDNINGKYPFFIADGCVAGDIHQSPYNGGISSSEIYTLSNKGMIAVLASSGLGTIGELDLFTTDLFHGIGSKLYGQSVGKNIQAAFRSAEGKPGKYLMNAVCLEMTLHGDPSIIIHSSKLSDYSVTSSSSSPVVYFTPSYVSTDQDSFDAHVAIDNIGKATNDNVRTDVKRIFSDGTSVTYSKTLPHIYFKETITIKMPVDPVKGPGLNKFEVHVDPMNTVAELQDISNNNISAPNEVSLMIYSGDIIPVYPYKYAIVPKDTITLKANTANPFADSARYVFEIDTTDLFNSPQKKTQYVTQKGSVVQAPYNKWSQPLILSQLLPDTIVYFWRIRRDDPNMLTFPWRESSFSYIPGKRGWGQSHFFQFLKGDRFQYLDTNRIPRTFDLEKQNHAITINTLNYTVHGGAVQGNSAFSLIWFYEDGLQMSLFSYLSGQNPGHPPPHVLVSVLDPVTGKVWGNDGTGKYGS